MRLRLSLALTLVFSFAPLTAIAVTSVYADESAAKTKWISESLLEVKTPVFSFNYGGVPISQLLSTWSNAKTEETALTGDRIRRTQRWTDPNTGLEVRMVSVEYRDFPAVEWTVYVANRGAQNTPLVENLRAIDTTLPVLESATLRTTRGDNYSAKSYEPLAFPLNATPQRFEPVGGRPSNGSWPYFNVDGGKQGYLLALGWPGQWEATFSAESNQVRVVGGQQTTHLVLKPGEEIRTPLVALLFWQRTDWIEAQNLWRQWLIEHNLPRPGGKMLTANTAIAVGDFPSTARGVIAALQQYIDNGIKVGYAWMDAGWYRIDDVSKWIDSPGIGSWVPDPKRFPNGIREVSDFVHRNGMKFILWFEPERACEKSFLWEERPEWLLPWEPENKGYSHIRALNLGSPAPREWITDYISRFITRDGLDVYRQDANADPLGAWKTGDAADRRGMTENLYVQGYLEFWDTLLRDHPHLLIDSCASGGRRNDLETVRRSVPLLRSDYQGPQLPEVGPKGWMTADVFDGNQGHTYGLSLWLPYYGTGEMSDDLYSFRSHLCPFNVVGTHGAYPDWAALRRRLADHEAVAGLAFRGDYYPLTPYDMLQTSWMAWEFYSPESGSGYLQAFRRANNVQPEIRLPLRGLDADSDYELTHRDNGTTVRKSGRELMTTGYTAYAAAPRTALLITFRKVPPLHQP